MLGVLFALLLAWATPASAWADEYVAKVDGAPYTSIDDAIEAAGDGDTVELLQDVTATKTFAKSLTFTGGYTLNVDTYAWMYSGDLIFDGANFNMTSNPDSPVANQTEHQRWLGMSLSNGSIVARNGAKVTFSFDSDSKSSTTTNCAIYGTNADIVVENGSIFAIYGKNTKGVTGQGLQLDSAGTVGIRVSGKSKFLIDGTNRGYVCSPDIYVDNSEFTVQNCTNNGSNGGPFVATNNSKVTFQDNAVLGLSTYSLRIEKGSTVTATGNGSTGVTVQNGDFYLDGTSKLIANDNGASSWGAGLNLWANGSGQVDAGATLTIVGNGGDGLDNQRTTIIQQGAHVTITNNSDGNGGGIYNPGNLTLPSDAVVYNNHATTSGADIYSTGTITFGHVGSDWKLDGVDQDGNPADCTDAIDGWYVDAKGARWVGHADTYDGVHVEEYAFDGDTTTVTGPLALKAAHGLGTVSVDPADITIYMGGTEGYEGVISDLDNGAFDASNSLPEPGFYFILPDDINQAFENAGIAPVGEAADLSQYMRIYTHGYTVDGEPVTLNWRLEQYGKTNSGAKGQFIYRIVPVPTEDQEAVPVRLQFTDADGKVYTSDNFDPSATGALNQHYTMQLYTALVDKNQVVFEVDVNGAKYYNGMKLETGDLNIRYVTGDQADVVTDVLNSADALASAKAENPDKAFAVLSDDTTYFINNSQVDVTDSAAPSLLFDNVVSDHTTEGASDYDQQLANRAVDVIANAGTTYTNPWYEAKYLDLVDANNGNVWLKSSNPVTVYWPYPAGTDENTQFQLVHFEGLNREMANSEISGNISSANAYTVDVENTPYGIKFTTDGFSPFVLMWEGEGEQPAPEDTKKPSKPVTGSLAQTGDNTLSIIAGVGAAGVACLGAAFAIKKRSE